MEDDAHKVDYDADDQKFAGRTVDEKSTGNEKKLRSKSPTNADTSNLDKATGMPPHWLTSNTLTFESVSFPKIVRTKIYLDTGDEFISRMEDYELL